MEQTSMFANVSEWLKAFWDSGAPVTLVYLLGFILVFGGVINFVRTREKGFGGAWEDGVVTLIAGSLLLNINAWFGIMTGAVFGNNATLNDVFGYSPDGLTGVNEQTRVIVEFVIITLAFIGFVSFVRGVYLMQVLQERQVTWGGVAVHIISGVVLMNFSIFAQGIAYILGGPVQALVNSLLAVTAGGGS